MTTEERIREVVNEISALPEDAGRELPFLDLGLDSLDYTEVVMELEEEFDINIPDDAAEKIQTIGEAVKHIESSVQT